MSFRRGRRRKRKLVFRPIYRPLRTWQALPILDDGAGIAGSDGIVGQLPVVVAWVLSPTRRLADLGILTWCLPQILINEIPVYVVHNNLLKKSYAVGCRCCGPLLDVHTNYTVNLPQVKVEVYCQIRKMAIHMVRAPSLLT
jgi:hypothetical protein